MVSQQHNTTNKITHLYKCISIKRPVSINTTRQQFTSVYLHSLIISYEIPKIYLYI